MLGFVTLVWVTAFLIAVPQVGQTYAPWPEDEFKDVICPLSAVSSPFPLEMHLIFFMESFRTLWGVTWVTHVS